MRTEFKLLIVSIVTVCFMAGSPNALADLNGPQQNTTGPVPPQEVRMRDALISFKTLGAPPVAPVTIAGVPDYNWTHGCGPTALGNVVGYYDTQGYYDLITGDANVQTNDVNQAMASGGDANGPYLPGSEKHYEDYSRPEDDPGPLLPDDYITQGRNPHTDDCIGDYMKTSQSNHPLGGNHYGWSWSSDMGPAFTGYVNLRNASYNPSYTEYSPVTGKALTWAVMMNEINHNRPMVFLVDLDGDGDTDHFVTVVGYDISTNQYGFLDTWNIVPTGIRWETFQNISTYQPWSIWGGWAFQLGQSEITKWEQMPDMTPYGMDVRCDRRDDTQRLLADDFMCEQTGPITKVKIWGSWKSDIKGQIKKIHLSIHSDDPIGPGGTDPYNTYSKPDLLLWAKDFNSPNFSESLFFDLTPLYEWWWQPGQMPVMNGDHKIWLYEIPIDSNQFVQEGTPTSPIIYWLDAYADINTVPTSAQFGWKTSGETTHRLDDAVWSNTNGTTWTEMHYPPTHPRNPISADLAFAIIMSEPEPNEEPKVKWRQRPDLSPNGVDVMAIAPLILADDFECNKTTKITDITVWGSWKDDYLPYGSPNSVSFTLSIHSDMPASHSPSGHSMPNEVLWLKENLRASEVSKEKENINEGWYNPYYSEYYFPGDHVCWKYVFHIPEVNAFCQQGTLENPIVYWLDVRAYPFDTSAQFGWKSSINHWNDDAVWVNGIEPYQGMWYELRYPSEHPLYYQSIDLAFVIDGNKPCTQAEDFGDAPDSAVAPGYPTLLINNGARHIINGVTFMGALVDAEGDGQPTANADGDDLNPPIPDDEDGVVIPLLLRGKSVTINVTASVPGALDAWIDFGADGSWAEAGDQIAAALPLVAGGNPITFVVPATATLGQTYARFRFSTAGGLQPFGPASNGEVEDYAVYIEEPPPENDLGDAPDSTNNSGVGMTTYPANVVANFPTVYLTGSPPFGPIHLQPLAVAYLGQNVTLENEADIGPDQDPTNNIIPPTNTSNMDLADDGVLNMPLILPHCLLTTFQYQINVVNPAVGLYVNVWFDWNRDGDWDDTMTCGSNNAPEWAVQNQFFAAGSLVAGINQKTTPSFRPWHPTGAQQPTSEIWMRITLSEQPWVSGGIMVGDGGSGPAAGYYFGETEDYRFVPITECVNSAAPFYTAWVGAGKPWSRPECWCCQRNCRGDADCLKQLNLYWVYTNDIATFRSAYAQLDNLLNQVKICADFDHKKQLNMYRVYTNDLAILRTYYGRPQPQVPVCPMDWDGDGDNDYNFWTN